jgi:hypothetical protein
MLSWLKTIQEFKDFDQPMWWDIIDPPHTLSIISCLWVGCENDQRAILDAEDIGGWMTHALGVGGSILNPVWATINTSVPRLHANARSVWPSISCAEENNSSFKEKDSFSHVIIVSSCNYIYESSNQGHVNDEFI